MSRENKRWVAVFVVGAILMWASTRAPKDSTGTVGSKGADVIAKDIGDATGIHRKR